MRAKLLPKNHRKPFRHKDIKQWISLTSSIFFVGIFAYLQEKKFSELCVPVAVGLFVFICQRICLFLLELFMYRQFDMSRTLQLLIQPSSTSSEYPNVHGFWLRILAFSLSLSHCSSKEMWFDDKFDVALLVYLIILGILLGWQDCALLESHRLMKPFTYCGGSAMAFSFYHGYLKLIAPGLISRITQFQDNNQLNTNQIPQKKLYILIPSSSYVFDKLDGYQQWTKTQDLKMYHVADKFESHKQDRSLVRNRIYKNTMYMVEYKEKEHYYVLLEAASPIKTFYETCKENKEFEKNKKEVISSFYFTLKKLIKENPETRNVIKLIYYDDELGDVSIADIVKERILKIKDKEKEQHNGQDGL
ncbi:stimulator of interferon genes protein-like isoform X2 [Macrosteles quadrilineatus]|uniref:stimulator of interferon genes protein-like isoform X2 n=1 Tax=Macrosteles quadrilineatus TaxID=74068 RepID=UPI0023E3409C|nr:stimulator of interferon genes protein-like isoform X2 [Macrosteles quadrilineatus]